MVAKNETHVGNGHSRIDPPPRAHPPLDWRVSVLKALRSEVALWAWRIAMLAGLSLLLMRSFDGSPVDVERRRRVADETPSQERR